MKKGFIYRIKDLSNDNFYIGATHSCRGFSHRCQQHKNDYKRYCNKNLNYRSYFDILQNNDYEYDILQEIEVEDYDDLLNAECIMLNWAKVSDVGDKLVNKCLMKRRFEEINCNLGNIL